MAYETGSEDPAHKGSQDAHSYEEILIKTIVSKPVQGPHSSGHAPDTQKALNIYHNNFIENGIRALAITFPSVEGLIGADSFRILAKHYLIDEPKTQFDWGDYGESFSEYIDEQEALAEYPFLGEAAELDWLIHLIQRKGDIEFRAQTFAKLETNDSADLRFVPAPGLTLMLSWFPVVDLHQLVHDPYLQSDEGVLALSLIHI